MDVRVDRVFPRDICGRIALGVASAFFVPVSGWVLIAIALNTELHRTVETWIWATLVSELAISLLLFFGCGLIWALATPRWLEKFLHGATRKLALALFLFWTPFAVLSIWSLGLLWQAH